MRRRHAGLLAALSASAVAAFAACTLNPQPLPPRDEFGGESAFADASTRDSGSFGSTPEVPGSSSDAGTGTQNTDSEGGAPAPGDGGDGGDGGLGDAGDADADGG